MAKRSGKFYRKNEAEVMKRLGFKPTKNSGSGWIEKEDGENEHCLCQLKSTDAKSISINKLDIDKLLYHASVSKKLPIFAIQFIEEDEVYLLVKPDDLIDIAKYVETNKPPKFMEDVLDNASMDVMMPMAKTTSNTIRSSENARNEFRKEMRNKIQKGLKSAT